MVFLYALAGLKAMHAIYDFARIVQAELEVNGSVRDVL